MHLIFFWQTQEEWSKVFELAGTIHLCGVVFYAVFASGELEAWGEPPSDPNKIPNWKIRQMSIKEASFAQQSFDQGGPGPQPPRPPAPSVATYGGQSLSGANQVQTTLANQPVQQTVPQQEYDWNSAWNDGGSASGYNTGYQQPQNNYDTRGNSYNYEHGDNYRNYQ